jgi:DNA-binding CsgD family transcriptional regulator
LTLVGREGELDRLVDLLRSRSRLPLLAALSGPAGIGKTAVWLAATEAAPSLGYRVLVSRPSEAEARFSFAGLFDLLGDALPEVAPELAAPQRRALEAALAIADPEASGVDEHVLAFAFLNALRKLAGASPLLLAVDDLQWLDPASMSLVRFALPRLDAEPIGAIVTVREAPPSWLRRERLQAIELGPLSMGAIHELLKARLGTGVPRPTLRRIWETSGGNPFFALEIARAVARSGGVGPGDELPIPADLEALVDERIEVLGPQAHEVAAVAAMLTDPTVRLVEAAVGDGAEAGLADAIGAKILDVDGERLRFTHPLLASAVRRRTPGAARRSLHARLAELVGDGEERGRHLALATDRPSPEIAVALEAAARSAYARGAPAGAAELAEQAHRLTPSSDVDDARRRVVFAAARHLEAGDAQRATLLLEDALETAPAGPARAVVLAHLGDARSHVTGPSAAIELRRRALAEAEGDTALEVELHLELALELRFTEGMESGLAHAEQAVQRATVVDDPVLRCRAAAAFGVLSFNSGRGIRQEEMRAAVALERSLPEWPLPEGPTMAFAHQLMWSGELDAARRVLDEARRALNARGDAREEDALWYLTVLEWRAGNWDRAAEHAAASAVLGEQFGHTAPGTRSWPRAVVAAHRGDEDEARAIAERELEAARSVRAVTPTAGFEWVLGLLELAHGDAEAALVCFRRGKVLRAPLRLHEPGQAWQLPDELEALVAVGALDEAETTVAPWAERARTLDRPWLLAVAERTRGQILGARGDLDGALAAFAAALAEHERDSDPFQRARTLLALGAAQRRAKQRGAARATLDEALSVFERLPAPRWAARARAEAARIGGRASSAGLTPSEERVAALVADGNTNREVAAALFVTERTVESALTRVYAKLGIRSRTELAARLRPSKS